ncbi:hypothetical protein BCS65_20995, partial [Vibrio cyclitrophicus]
LPITEEIVLGDCMLRSVTGIWVFNLLKFLGLERFRIYRETLSRFRAPLQLRRQMIGLLRPRQEETATVFGLKTLKNS